MNIGDKIPQSLGFAMNGNEELSSQFAGKKLVIYFYPKDNTPGCTAEACSFSNEYSQLRNAGYEIIGISKNSATSHKKFAEKYSLPFTLISDVDLKLNQEFGVWREKKMCGRTSLGTVRTTFVTDTDGIITHIISKVDTKNAANQIHELK